jgi:hypothetical protein
VELPGGYFDSRTIKIEILRWAVMGDKKIYIVAKIFDQQGCLAYLCKTPNEARCVLGTLEALRADGVQIVILDSPEIYSEYAPYTYIEDLKEFIDKVAQMNRVSPVFRSY